MSVEKLLLHYRKDILYTDQPTNGPPRRLNLQISGSRHHIASGRIHGMLQKNDFAAAAALRIAPAAGPARAALPHAARD